MVSYPSTGWSDSRMLRNKHLDWEKITNLWETTKISNEDHTNLDINIATEKLREARRTWKKIKKEAPALRAQVLQDQAEEYANKHNTTQEIAGQKSFNNGRSPWPITFRPKKSTSNKIWDWSGIIKI